MNPQKDSAYWSNVDLESVDRCPICDWPADAELLHSAVPDLLENVPGEWDVAKCRACRSLFLRKRPRGDVLHKAYQTYYTHQTEGEAPSNGQGWVWALINDYLNQQYGSDRIPQTALGNFLVKATPPIRQQLDYFLRRLPRDAGRLLDIGCGNGVFLARAGECGWEVHGIEPDSAAARVATKFAANIYQTTFESFETPLRFDAITASHVIEHVYEPVEFLKHALSLLNPGGTFWLSTPNAGSIGHKWYKGAWRGLEPPRHLSIFSARALVATLRRAGFEKVVLHKRGRGSNYIIRESQLNASRVTGARKKLIPPLLVDLLASISPLLGEELIVTGVRPR